jgi:hypothetical protein
MRTFVATFVLVLGCSGSDPTPTHRCTSGNENAAANIEFPHLQANQTMQNDVNPQAVDPSCDPVVVQPQPVK